MTNVIAAKRFGIKFRTDPKSFVGSVCKRLREKKWVLTYTLYFVSQMGINKRY